jgi:hypothetical protein
MAKDDQQATIIAGMTVAETPDALMLRRTWFWTIVAASCVSMVASCFGIPACTFVYMLFFDFDSAAKEIPKAERFTAWLVLFSVTCVFWIVIIIVGRYFARDLVEGRSWLILNRTANEVTLGSKVIGKFTDIARIHMKRHVDAEGDRFSLYVDAAGDRWPPLQVRAVSTAGEVESLGRRLADYCRVPFVLDG